MTTRFASIKETIPPQTTPTLDHFEVKSIPTPTITGENQVLFETLYVSVDPYMRMRCFEGSRYGFFGIGVPTTGAGVGRVIESTHNNYKVGDIIRGSQWPAQEIVLLDEKSLEGKKKIENIDPSLYPTLIGNLGMPGFTAYFGLVDRSDYKAGETILISGASGAVGNVLGQLAKDVGLRVVGITSTQDKANFLREVGFDEVILYPGKSKEQLSQEIKNTCPNGVDIYFDNVGGIISDAAIENINQNGRSPICGAISKYNTSDLGPSTFANSEETQNILNQKNIKREFFTVSNYPTRYDEAFDYLLDKVKTGKLKNRETVYDGIENWSRAFVGLFSGENTGKAVVKINNI